MLVMVEDFLFLLCLDINTDWQRKKRGFDNFSELFFSPSIPTHSLYFSHLKPINHAR